MEKSTRSKIQEPRKLVLETKEATMEGLCTDGEAIYKAGFGCISVKIPEYLTNISNINSSRAIFMESLYDAYDGKLPIKSIKSEKRRDNLEKIPVNCLAYSDPTSLKNFVVKNRFYEQLSTAFSRRCMINFQPERTMVYKPIPDKKLRELKTKLKECGRELFKIFQKIPHRGCYVMLSETIDVLNDYQGKLFKKYNEEDDDILKKEILSRHLKAVKLSNLFACINHPEELVIKPEDVQQAIKMVEYLSGDLKLLLNYKPKMKDWYDRLYEFFKENIDKSFSKTEITTEYFRKIGIPRDKFRKCFDDLIQGVKDIASYDDYILFEDESPKNGIYYTLKKYIEPKLSDGVQGLEELLA